MRNGLRVVGRSSLLAIIAASVVGSSAWALQGRDSAGVRIHVLPPLLTSRVGFELGAKPRIDMGGLEDVVENEFKPSQGYLRAVELSDGGWAVIDETRMHLFDRSGKRLRIVGRAGRGPEEFTYLMAICRTRGDTLLLSDGNVRRMAVLTGTGSFVRTFLQDTLGSPPFDGCFSDGTAILTRRLPSAPGTLGPSRVNRIRLDGSPVGTLFDFASPFDMVTQAAVELVAAQDRLIVADGPSGEIRIHALTGRLVSILRASDERIAVTSEAAEERMKRTIPRGTPADQVAQRMDRMRSFGYAKHWPLFTSAVVGADGLIWVRQYDPAPVYPAPAWWIALDPAGRVAGRLMLPAPKQGQMPMQVISFGRGEVLIRRADDDGAAHLSVFPLVRK
jgi:hypothetical protein